MLESLHCICMLELVCSMFCFCYSYVVWFMIIMLWISEGNERIHLVREQQGAKLHGSRRMRSMNSNLLQCFIYLTTGSCHGRTFSILSTLWYYIEKSFLMADLNLNFFCYYSNLHCFPSMLCLQCPFVLCYFQEQLYWWRWPAKSKDDFSPLHHATN